MLSIHSCSSSAPHRNSRRKTWTRHNRFRAQALQVSGCPIRRRVIYLNVLGKTPLWHRTTTMLHPIEVFDRVCGKSKIVKSNIWLPQSSNAIGVGGIRNVNCIGDVSAPPIDEVGGAGPDNIVRVERRKVADKHIPTNADPRIAYDTTAVHPLEKRRCCRGRGG